jgi:hypothetical protein
LFTVDPVESPNEIVGVHGKGMVVKSTEDHIEAMSPFIRDIDLLEVSAMGHTPSEAMHIGLKQDDVTLTALDEYKEPIAMFGVGQVMNLAYIWCLGTHGVSDNAYQFIKASRSYVKALSKPYKCVHNFVHKDNTMAINWLRFCGAYFIRNIEISNQPFIEFIIKSENV